MKMDSRLSRKKTLPDVFSTLCFQYIIILGEVVGTQYNTSENINNRALWKLYAIAVVSQNISCTILLL